MWAALAAELLGAIVEAGRYALSHPQVAAKLARDVKAAVGTVSDRPVHPDAVAAQVAGIAAARAVAAQEFGRRFKK